MIQGGNQVESDPTEEQIKAQIAEAVRILREDGVHIHKTYAEFQKTLSEDQPESDPDPKEGDPPPPKPDKEVKNPERKGLWWGARQ